MEIMGHVYDSINKNGWNYNSPWKSKNPYQNDKEKDRNVNITTNVSINASNVSNNATAGNVTENSAPSPTPAEAAALFSKNITFKLNNT